MKKIVGLVLFVGLFGAAIFFAKKNDPQPPQQAELASRAPSGLPGQQAMIDQITKMILSIQDKSQINSTVANIVKIAQNPEAKAYPGVQIMAAIAGILPQFEGIIWRCREIVEPSDWLHMTALFRLRTIAYNDFVYGHHVRALFDYLVDPSDVKGQPFKKVSDLQDYLLNQVAPVMEGVLARATSNEMMQLPDANFEFQFDRRIMTGVRDQISFIDPEEAVKTFIKPYHYTMTFLLQRALMSIYYFGTLDMDDLPLVVARVLKATTLNTFKSDLRILGGDTAMGVTPQLVFEAIKKSSSTFLEFRRELGDAQVKALLDKSFALGKQSAQYQNMAYVCGLKYHEGANLNYPSDCLGFPDSWRPNRFYSNGSKYLFDPNRMAINFKAKYHAFRDRARAYTAAAEKPNDYYTLTSDVTGKQLRVRLHAFFEPKNSQRSFLPTSYLAPGDASTTVIVGGKSVKKWNYDHGQPVSYDDYTFGGFFDPAQVRDLASLENAMTTLLYTDSVAPFAVFIRKPSPVRFIVPMQEIMNAN